MIHSNHFILADGRWSGAHGIGRFSQEMLSRLQYTDILLQGPSPLGMKNLYWLPYQLSKSKKSHRVFFSPGFMPPLYSSIPFVFTIHDLIHLYGPTEDRYSSVKKLFYDKIIKVAALRARFVITVSEYSKNQIFSWAKIPAEKVIVIKNGASAAFSSNGTKHTPGYPYLLYVGNAKPHKNIPRLLQAFAQANIDSSIKLILTCALTPALHLFIQQNHLQNRIIFNNGLSEMTLAEYYRGALALLFPSLYEGFGLPVIEAMVSGIPVMTSHVTSLPEVAGDAAILINPLDIDSMAFNIEQIVTNDGLRKNLMAKGFKQAKQYSWDQSAHLLQDILTKM